ncbi:hypothetical protein BLNAU_5639 [Blattamonas nauphoetae]|uniref:Uncharacterized protein n=1 Tax=Blattamonas nauphoetae TaxID=2049346 RepID=A0ABQ9Y6L1_9EUKA|nr:hypothetical protein BLNAU_5639 [Blattamonas nauphoetae]
MNFSVSIEDALDVKTYLVNKPQDIKQPIFEDTYRSPIDLLAVANSQPFLEETMMVRKGTLKYVTEDGLHVIGPVPNADDEFIGLFDRIVRRGVKQGDECDSTNSTNDPLHSKKFQLEKDSLEKLSNETRIYQHQITAELSFPKDLLTLVEDGTFRERAVEDRQPSKSDQLQTAELSLLKKAETLRNCRNMLLEKAQQLTVEWKKDCRAVSDLSRLRSDWLLQKTSERGRIRVNWGLKEDRVAGGSYPSLQSLLPTNLPAEEICRRLRHIQLHHLTQRILQNLQKDPSNRVLSDSAVHIPLNLRTSMILSATDLIKNPGYLLIQPHPAEAASTAILPFSTLPFIPCLPINSPTHPHFINIIRATLLRAVLSPHLSSTPTMTEQIVSLFSKLEQFTSLSSHLPPPQSLLLPHFYPFLPEHESAPIILQSSAASTTLFVDQNHVQLPYPFSAFPHSQSLSFALMNELQSSEG